MGGPHRSESDQSRDSIALIQQTAAKSDGDKARRLAFYTERKVVSIPYDPHVMTMGTHPSWAPTVVCGPQCITSV